MESYKIIKAFSDIKSELRTQNKVSKAHSDLRLWFSLTDGVLCAHDYHDHHCGIAISIKTNGKWIIRLDSKTYGYSLICDAFEKNSEHEIVAYLNRLYDHYGYYK